MGSLKIGVALWSLSAGETEEGLLRALETVAHIGFQGVQLWNVASYGPCVLDPDVCTGAQRAEWRKRVESFGLQISGFCAQMSGPKHFGGFDEAEGIEERISKTQRCIELAVDMGAPIVTTHPGVIPEDQNDPRYPIIRGAIEQIVQHAEKVGGVFCIETGMESPPVLRQFIEDIGSPALKVNFDPANLLWYGVLEGVRELAPYIVHTHAKDQHPETKKPTVGQGAVPWDDYIASLKSIGYDGWFAVEDESGQDVVESLRQGLEFLKRY
ncbi:MAG: sugar phosphate isomerase/epimerase family protein [Armatimonadota bacterium]|nr:sugar phosphate isomerase/epimerase family protein [Armatimonadota bacterium]